MREDNKSLIEEVQKRSFKLLRDLTNYDEKSKGYGLTLDHNEKRRVASIASTGFTLAGYVIGVKYGYIEFDEALKITIKTLETLAYNAEHYKGFFSHFIDVKTARRINKSEFSTIDTVLCIKGIMVVSEFFKNEEVTKLSDIIIDRIDWKDFVHTHMDEKRFYMSYNPDKDGDYAEGNAGYIFQWHMLAEQIVMYIIAAGSGQLSDELSMELYHGFERKKGSYGGYTYDYSPGNTLFVYQYPLCFLDGKNWVDDQGFSWFNNLRMATLGHRAWNLKNYHKYKTFAKETFGLTASSTPKGYGVFHCIPNDLGKVMTDGTVAPNAMIGSLISNTKEVIKAMNYMKTLPNVWGEYGFIDAYNFEGEENWYSNKYITIDKGLELLMTNAYLSGDVVNNFMNHPIIKKGLEVLKWKRI